MELSTKARNFYSYFEECYKLDNKEFTVTNMLSRKYPYTWIVEKNEELYSKRLPLIPYTNKKVVELEKDLTLYKFEKSLYYGCFFLLGRNQNAFLSKDKRICAPLILFPAEIEIREEEYFLKISQEEYIVNRNAVSQLSFKNGDFSKDTFIDEFTKCFDNDRFNSMGIKTIFDRYFENIDTEELALFPKVWSSTRIKKELASREFDEGEFKLVPAAGTVLLEKSESSLKVIHDLREMSKRDDFNSSLSDLLTNHKTSFLPHHSLYEYRLNTDQLHGLKNSYVYPNSVIVGPPGTGKTYTITSIVADAVLNNQSVLIVSKTKQAVEVIRTMLENEYKLKNYLIHTTGHSYKISFKAKIRQYLSGISPSSRQSNKEEDLEKMFLTLSELEYDFEKIVNRELTVSDLHFSEDLSLYQKWRKYYLTKRSSNDTKIWNISDSINRMLFSLEKAVNIFTMLKIRKNIYANAGIFRKDLTLYYDALDSQNFTEYKRILDKVDHKKIVTVFPIWLANLSELNSILPLQKDLFDLVIIDEATQCNIASALPALYRAKRAVVVGDPNQLRHYSFISNDQQQRLRQAYDLPTDRMFDYRNKSILDVFLSKIENQNQISFLREHFRSTPSLIEFSNTKFYNDQLEILKSTPDYMIASQIELIRISGERNEKGINEKEAEAIINKLDEIIYKYKNTEKIPSVGIVSLFSSQVKFVNNLLKNKYDIDILKKYKILCGTPYHFQGSEREIMLLSICLSDDSHPSAFNHANKPEVLNVAITRARSFQYVFTSLTSKELGNESLLEDYFRFITKFETEKNEETFTDIFQEEVKETLIKQGIKDIKLGFPIAGSNLDLLLTHNKKHYFIDLIGYPGAYQEAFSMERYRTLARTGIASIPLHYSFWQKNKMEAVKKIISYLD